MMYIRPIRPTDTDLFCSILDRTSADDRYCRFLHVVNHFDPDEVRRFCGSGADLIGFIATSNGRALGAVHAYFLDDGSAELAIVVANDARHGGVGRALVERLIDALVQRGCPRLIAYAFCENYAMVSLARSFGMQHAGGDSTVAKWALDLPVPIAA